MSYSYGLSFQLLFTQTLGYHQKYCNFPSFLCSEIKLIIPLYNWKCKVFDPPTKYILSVNLFCSL